VHAENIKQMPEGRRGGLVVAAGLMGNLLFLRPPAGPRSTHLFLPPITTWDHRYWFSPIRLRVINFLLRQKKWKPLGRKRGGHPERRRRRRRKMPPERRLLEVS